MSRRHYIYVTTNRVNGKQYLGQHVTHAESEQEMEQDGYLGSGTLLQDAIRKYGRQCFTKRILYIAQDQAEADFMEARFIDGIGVLENREQWYNRAAGGQYERSDRHSELMSDIMKRLTNDPEYRRKRGWTLTPGESTRPYEERLRGQRIRLINTLRWLKKKKEREWLESSEGKAFKREYMAHIRGELSRSQEHQEHLQRLNAWHKTDLGRIAMSQATTGMPRKSTNTYSNAEFDRMVMQSGMTNADIARKFGVDRKIISQMRKGSQKINGRIYTRYVRDDVFEYVRDIGGS